MLIKKTITRAALIFLIFLMTVSLTKSQQTPVDSIDNNSSIIENIDAEENLLDSNEVYKQQFDSLSKEGEWIEASKSEFLRDLSLETGEDLEANYPSTTEIVYLWRPYCANDNWNPYYNGSWVFSSYGWVWASSYNWGWAPYNYGRWYCSNYYGWVWLPGNVWASNWVNWRQYNNYVGWYPVCPRVHWRHHNKFYTNKKFASHPDKWIVTEKKDFTKKIDENRIVKTNLNRTILKNSVKVKSVVYDKDRESPKFRYSGPEVADISKESGVKIIPKNIEVAGKNQDTKSSENSGVKNNSDSKKSKSNETVKKYEDKNKNIKKENYNAPEKKNQVKDNKKENNGTENNSTGSEKKNNDGKNSNKSEKKNDSNKKSVNNKSSKSDNPNGTTKRHSKK